MITVVTVNAVTGDEQSHDPLVGPRSVPPGDRPPEHAADDALADAAPTCRRAVELGIRVERPSHRRTPRWRRRPACRRPIASRRRSPTALGSPKRSSNQTRNRRPDASIAASVEPSGVAEIITHSRLPSQFGHSDKPHATVTVTAAESQCQRQSGCVEPRRAPRLPSRSDRSATRSTPNTNPATNSPGTRPGGSG